jgi:hypothetical protein
MFGTYFKNKFGKKKEVPAAEQFYSPLRIGLHSTIDIPTVDWLVMQQGLNEKMVLPSGRMTVLAIGKTVTDGDEIYNVYLTDQNKEEFILQLFCAAPAIGEMLVSEATLYKQVVNIVPLTKDEWSENMDAIGFNTIELDDNTYNRVWVADHDGRIDLVEFDENVVAHNKEMSYYNNYLLYSRTFTSVTGTEETEMLLVGVEETSETAEIIMMLGLAVPLSNINIQ